MVHIGIERALVLWTLVSACHGHVTLTYPPARRYPFDFMDVQSTPGPCGMSKGFGPITNLQANEIITVTWHLAYPHRGGYRIALLDAKEEEIRSFTDGFIATPDATTLSHDILIPDVECRNCTIQLLRQAAEWTTGCNNGRYEFYSCADVNILKYTFVTQCSYHGVYDGSACVCDTLWAGPKCQYQEDCETDVDCLNQGQCMKGVSTRYPRNNCYCNPGFFGTKCEKRSTVTTLDGLDLTKHVKTSVKGTEDYKIYRRIISETTEMEVVLMAKTNTWVGFGWRPDGYRSGCKLWPLLPSYPDRTTGGKWKVEGETTTQDTTTKYATTEQLTTATTVTEKTSTSDWGRATTDWRFTKDFTNAGQGGVTIIGTGGDGSSSTNFTWTGNNMTGNNPDGNTGSGKWTTRHHWCPSGDCSRANVTWYYNDNNVTFEVFFKGIKDYWSNWIALGISDDEKMVNTDVILLRTDDHYHFVALDSYIGGQRAPPKIDESQDVNLTSASLENDVLKFLVVRPLVTGDINDKQIGEKTYFLFLADGHRIGNTLLRHRNRYISPEVCLSPSCEKALGLGKINAQGAWEFSDDWNLIEPSSGRRRREAGAMAEGGAAEGETEAEGEGVGEGEGEPGDSCGALFAGNSPTTGDTIHPMDCTDMVIGSAKGPLSRIGDYYSRDRSTPLSDEALGGSNSLTAAIGEENGGWTTILFRRKLSAGSDAADHSFERGPMHVVWARGQEPGNIHHVPASGLEHNQSAASIPNYYKEDELKYHGRDLDGTSYGHRGYLTLDFFSQPTGNGGTGGVDTGGVWTGTGSTGSGKSYSHPSGRYIVTWQRDNANNDMMYTISARLSDTERQWMAIGFNSQDRMIGADVMMAWMENGKPVVSDRHITSYSQPIVDVAQNIKLIDGSVMNGMTSVTFARPLVTGDADDFNFNATSCAYVLVSWGGSVSGRGPSAYLGKHAQSQSTGLRRCFGREPGLPTDAPIGPTGQPPNRLTLKRRVPFTLKLPIAWDDAYGTSYSSLAKGLNSDILPSLKNIFLNMDGYRNVTVNRFRKGDDPNTVYVDSDTLMERSGPSAPEIEAGMRKSVSDRLQQLVAAEPAALGPYPLSKDYLVGTPESGESTGVSTGAPPGPTGQPPNWMTLKRRVPFTLKLPIRWNDAYGMYNSSLATGLRSDILPSLKNIFINTNGYQNVTVNRFRKGDDPNAVYVDSDTLMERSGPSAPEVEAGMQKSVSDRLAQLVAADPAALGAYPLSKEYLVGAPESDAPTGVSTGTPQGPTGQPPNLMPLKRRVPFTLKLPIRWNDAYGTSYSSLANGLRTDILPSLKNIFRNMDGYQTVTVNRFRKGEDPNTVYVESDTLMERSGPSVPEVEAGMRKSVSDRLQQLVAPEPAALGPYPLSKEFLVGAPESGSPPGPSTLPPNWVTLKRRVPFTLKLPIAWDDAYGTYTSSPATGLRSDILPSLKNIFLDMDGYRNVTVNRLRKEDDPNNVYVDSDTLMERSGPSAPEVEAGMQKSVSDRLAQFVAADPAALGAYPLSKEYLVGAPESGPPAPWITIKRDVPFTLKLPIGWKDGYGSDNSSLAQGLRGEILPPLKNIFIDVNGYQDVQVKGFRADKDDPETVYVDSTAKMERAGPSVPEVEAGMRKSVSDRLEQLVAAPAPALGAYPLSQAYLVGAPAPGPAKDWVTIERDVPFTLKLPMAWKEEYGSPDSGVAQGLKADLTPGLKDLFNGMDGYKDVKVKGFRAGEDPETVYVDSTAQMLRSGPSAPEVEGGMRKSVSDRLGDFVAGEPGKPAALGGHPVDDTFTVGDPQPVIGGPMDPAAASGPSPLSTLGEIIIALAVVGLLFLALLALATCLKRCLAARHFRRMSQVAYGEKNHGFEGSNLGLSSPYTELPNGTSALTGEPNYNMAHRGSTASQGLYIVPSSVAGYQNSRKLSQDTNGFLHTAHSSANGQAWMLSGDIFGSGSQARMSSGEILGSSSQARMSSGDILGSGGQARISSGESYGYSQSGMSSGDILGSGSQARMSSGDILGSSSQARMSSGDILGSGGQARISSGESYGNNQSRMSSGNVLSLNQARMSSGEALGYNQTRMSSGDVLHSNQARILANEALGYNQARMSSGDVVDSSNARMISASNAQGYSQARKASTVMFSTTENRKSSAAHLLGNGHAMKSSSDGFSHRSNEHRSSAAHLLGNAQAIQSSGERFDHGSNEHMSSAETDDFNQARKASTIIIDSSNRKRSLGDILEQSQAGKSSALVLGSGEQRVSSGDILGTSAARRPALYNRKQSNAVTVETREYFRSAEAPTSSDAKYLKSGQFATVKSAQYIHGGDTISGDDLRLIINEEPTVTKNSRYFESTEMVSGGDSSHSGHAFGNRESAQRGSVAYVRCGEIGESSTDVKYVLMGEQAMSEDLKYLESHGGAISGGREFDYDMDGEPIVITGIHSKEESKIGASGGKSIVSGVTGAAFSSVGTTSGERRTSSSGTEAKYVFREEHSSSGGDAKYMQSNGGVNSVGDVRYVYFDKNIPLDNSESMQKKADSHDSSYMRSYRSESRQY